MADKLTIAAVLHRFADLLSSHPDTSAQLHQLVADNVETDEEKEAAPKNPFADKTDEEVIGAAIGGNEDAKAEYAARQEAKASAPPPAPAPPAPTPAPPAPTGQA